MGRPVALAVAGSDSGGGAGIQADLKTIEARGAFGASAITALTAQNTTGVRASAATDPGMVREQIRAVDDDLGVDAAKTGMLANAEVAAAAAEELTDADFPVVVDPVVVAESGDRLLSAAGEAVVREKLVPAAALVTPNAPEAELLTGIEVESADDAREAGRALREMGADAALVTGGHLDGAAIVDVLVGDEVREFRSPRVPDANSHGGGCTLSAAIAADLARGSALSTAVENAEALLDRAVAHGHDLGDGTGPVHHLADLRARADAPRALREVRETVRAFETPAMAPLIPEVGTTVAVAPETATEPADVAACEGRLTRVSDGVRAPGGAALGASSHVARLLLGVREHDRRVTAACNLRASDAVREAVENELTVATVDRTREPDDAAGTMDWVAERVLTRRDGDAPDAIVDDGAHGKEPMVRVLAPDAETLRELVLGVAELTPSAVRSPPG
ncbi:MULTISPECIES: bifunctional hydroxymethylpyrimidine kinase/phosphomethylpyrimidine kinase [Halolamina]|uniref:Hydroxymethylpyrimidine/phosphomethylpyrimidine kinase n=1 Tax=Halolamina pelagica TaxID=699431 RepID=A0A1I5UD72_9EURY|nr:MULTISPECIES: bifunctional hydroxymethylpyrimidine kinase/phosphomethylpyrimidine kinase [Halolamina]NHX37234.1 bifunctional hydroxymethylpyrimidine kinase/phosphomethylpyrimidine kinase [Halolamina sp. R1-12]SFP93205.1 hydroxymethylpyrimidine/phosphomethylpyrimidine kinase [Halolamina pelagica]